MSGEYILAAIPPRGDRTPVFGRFPENEAQEHVHAPYDEKEKRGNKREVIDMLGKNRGTDA